MAAKPASVKIKEVRRLEDTVARLGGDGDNWHMSWAGDDPYYSFNMQKVELAIE